MPCDAITVSTASPALSRSVSETLADTDCSLRRRTWTPSPVIRLSIALHAVAALGVILHPSGWAWLLGAVVANHVFLGAVGMWPGSRLLGPNLIRIPASRSGGGVGVVALSFDDGPDPEVTPRIMDLLERHDATASFFCIGERAAAWPEIVRDLARRGHSVENHTERHPYLFACFGLRALRREIEAAQVTLAQLSGAAPRFFRAPAGLRSPLLDPVLARSGLLLTSWSRRGHDCVRRDPEAVLRQITSGLRDGDILLLHDGSYARTRDGTPVVLAVLPRLLDHLCARGLRAVSLPEALAAESPERPRSSCDQPSS
ncbi:MAG: polysaccharide deacetylase family protein [Alphaproteobacteria bacterium]|nr:polysaccharide deacetylase family protein [Alphaproteobacteria bacterium]